MSVQQDFWKPKPYDFEALVAGVDLNKLSISYINRAGAHVQTIIGKQAIWNNLERFYDVYDRAHFESTSISPGNDVWDNRRKVAAK